MTILVVVLAVAVLALAFYAFVLPRLKHPLNPLAGRSTAMAHVLHQHPADSPGYTRLVVREPVGHKQAAETVTAYGPSTHPNNELVAHEIHLHGQREFDVPSGSIVRFPDGTDLHLDAD